MVYGFKRNETDSKTTRKSFKRAKGLCKTDDEIQSENGKENRAENSDSLVLVDKICIRCYELGELRRKELDNKLFGIKFYNIVLFGGLIFFGSMAFALLTSLSGLDPNTYSCFNQKFWVLTFLILNSFGLTFIFMYLFVKNWGGIK